VLTQSMMSWVTDVVMQLQSWPTQAKLTWIASLCQLDESTHCDKVIPLQAQHIPHQHVLPPCLHQPTQGREALIQPIHTHYYQGQEPNPQCSTQHTDSLVSRPSHPEFVACSTNVAW